MAYNKILRIILLTVIVCVLLSHRQHTVKGTPTNLAESNSNINHNHPNRNRPSRFNNRIAASQYARARLEPDFILDDDDLFDLSKRQSDDYGHMRFGKREFDDYGHMRFGRSGTD